ncbi:MAG: molybdopterin biosynthesis protein, partial [Candidatus Heimdallarchaeota archaeon]|nr:molybdopterin biosynthesis protein [Candidatus Heimdallarchaeota archaeon]
KVVDELGKPGLLVHGVKVKPGKPTILAVCDGTPVIGLPGYPASALSITSLFVVPLIRKLAGYKPTTERTKVKAIVKRKIRSVEGRYEFKPMNLVKTRDSWFTFPVPGGSGAITSIVQADGFIEIPEDVKFIEPNTEVTISLFSEYIKPFDIQIIGSHCMALAHLQDVFMEEFPQYSVRSLGIGSTGGVAAIRREEAHIAGIHILDENKGYNKWLEDEMNIKIIPGYYRMQGLIVKKGNPKQIFGLNDLLRSDIKFINRNKGSGTRILLDILFEKMNIDKEKIIGYSQSVKSHTSAAEFVKKGIVDVAVGVESVVTSELDFIPLREEEYDLAIPTYFLDLPAIISFIETLQSDKFKARINKLKGYRLK